MRNNAEWCDAVCAAYGIVGTFHEHVWACESRTPPLYPDAVTLDRVASAADALEHVETSTPGCSVKDSYSALDLGRAGFRVLFDATWIALTTTTPGSSVPDRWSRVTDTDALDRWRRASDRDLADALLDNVDILVLAERTSDNEIVAGGVLNCDDTVVGISNVFAVDHDLDRVWTACLALAAGSFPGLPVVGYEAGAPLASACRHGFEALGQLRVWIDDRLSRSTAEPRR